MKRTRLLTIFVLVLVSLGGVLMTTPHPVAAIETLYIFGDSLSDVGNVFQSTFGLYPSDPPYFKGRYSNGQIWIDYLGDSLNLPQSQRINFAWGGATIGGELGLVPSLQHQVQSFLGQPSPNPGALSQALFVLWAGANDYLLNRHTTTAPVDHLTTAITDLITAGATKLLVANLPDLGQLPSTRDRPETDHLTTLSQTHNRALTQSIQRLRQQYPTVQIALLDAESLYQTALQNPLEFEFRNVTAACLSERQVCDHPENFLFWDAIHPTTAAHRVLGRAALTTLFQAKLLKSRAAILP